MKETATQKKSTKDDHKFLLPHKTAIANFIVFTWDVGLKLRETLPTPYIVGKKKKFSPKLLGVRIFLNTWNKSNDLCH